MLALFVKTKDGQWNFEGIKPLQMFDQIVIANYEYEQECGRGTTRVFMLDW